MNSVYDETRVRLLTASLDWAALDLMLSAWAGTPDYTPTDTTIANIKGRGAVELGFSLPINSASVSVDGTAQTDQVVIPMVPIGPAVTWFTMSDRDAAHDQSKLIIFIDEATELPFVPNGLDLLVNPDWLQMRGWWRP